MRMISCIFAVVGVACGKPAAPPAHDDAKHQVAPRDAAPLELPARPLGMASVDGFYWRKRGGQPAFKIARKAEAHEAWEVVASACKDALQADPGHLEAAWLYAVALAKTSQLDKVTAPLAVAGAGDFGKWALASLEQPALQPYLAT